MSFHSIDFENQSVLISQKVVSKQTKKDENRYIIIRIVTSLKF